jgi:multidrug efflux system membrane fusion protein
MKASRITAVGLIAAAAMWILSGHFLPHESTESRAALQTRDADKQRPFRVAVVDTELRQHARKLLLSGRTEADRKVTAFARTNGVLTELRVRRGSRVKQGEVMAVLSDDAREAQVAQARALLEQRKAELEAKRRLIQMNAYPRLELSNLEAQFKAAEAGLAAAEAERDRGLIVAPFDGVVTEVSEVGTSAFSFTGKEIAMVMAMDPMLAVVEVSERRVSSIRLGSVAEVRLVSGETRQGRVRYVSLSAVQATRTYRVEVQMPNADGAIPDGITAEVAIPLAPTPATRVPRSALVFASSGDLGVRTVDSEGKVSFIPTTIIEDDQSHMWIAGVPDGARVIVQGQDFVREGMRVEAVIAAEQSARR